MIGRPPPLVFPFYLFDNPHSLQPAQPVCSLGRIERRVDCGRLKAELAERIHLVLHEADQRRQDHDRPRQQAGRNLERQGLPRPGGHHRDAVVSGQHCLDHVELAGPKRWVAEYLSKDTQWIDPR
ncbi:MAG: hypothetical protein P8Y07_09750 [Gemmatimonadales bacterium]